MVLWQSSPNDVLETPMPLPRPLMPTLPLSPDMTVFIPTLAIAFKTPVSLSQNIQKQNVQEASLIPTNGGTDDSSLTPTQLPQLPPSPGTTVSVPPLASALETPVSLLQNMQEASLAIPVLSLQNVQAPPSLVTNTPLVCRKSLTPNDVLVIPKPKVATERIVTGGCNICAAASPGSTTGLCGVDPKAARAFVDIAMPQSCPFSVDIVKQLTILETTGKEV